MEITWGAERREEVCRGSAGDVSFKALLCAVWCLRAAAAASPPSAGFEANHHSSSTAAPSSSPSAVQSSRPSQQFLARFTQALSRAGAAVRTEEPASSAASAPVLHSLLGGAASTTPGSDDVILYLMESGSREDVPTVAVSTASCTAYLAFSTKIVMMQTRRCVGLIRRRSG
ncbi:uncharacterized protein LOC105919514 isoform X3 [Fundulus heteroclitus]|uniref:uncharacterized protein LOC105919514 isoform X3 n=1 Tax=Fundulus heteroclitus TaxID=8078 RepID=UPI00165C430E|nr:uncharacterized protein LOC105919514 isoform X3 [Fundulus heteroclitus]